MIDPSFEKVMEAEARRPEVRAREAAEERRREDAKAVARASRAAAMELVRSDGWKWFVDAMEALAREREREVLNVQVQHDPRYEDRLRGQAYVYRRIPRLVVETANQAIEED